MTSFLHVSAYLCRNLDVTVKILFGLQEKNGSLDAAGICNLSVQWMISECMAMCMTCPHQWQTHLAKKYLL